MPMDSRIDPRCNWVKIIDSMLIPRWRITKVTFMDEEESQGKHHMFARVKLADDKPAVNTVVVYGYPTFGQPEDTSAQKTDVNGETNFGMYNDVVDGVGPYWMYVQSPLRADRVENMGLIGHRHVSYIVDWQWYEAEPEPLPEPLTLEAAVMQAARSEPWMAVNNTAALWKYAQEHHFEDQQTDEIEFLFHDDTFIVQVFNKAILYCKKGDWANIGSIGK